MTPRPTVLLLMLAALAGCAQNPRDTVLALDTDARRYRTRECREARLAALNYNDRSIVRTAVGVAGNLIVPFAGTAAALALSAERNERREELNEAVGRNCLPDPFNERRRPARRNNSRRR